MGTMATTDKPVGNHHPEFTMRSPRALLSVALIGLFSLLATSAQAELAVITTTTDLAHLVEQIGGPHVQVESLCKANQDPHFVQARPSLMVKLRRADLVVSVGLDLEIGWLPLLLRGARNPKILRGQPGNLPLGTLVTALGVPASTDASQGHLHPRGNPHYWLDPVVFETLIAPTAARLAQLDPANAATYTANAAAYAKTLNQKITGWAQQMQPHAGTAVLNYHDTFRYFMQRYHLTSAGTLENKPGVPPSPRHLSTLIQSAKQAKIPVLLHETFQDAKSSELVAKRSGATLLVLPVSVGAGGTRSYIALMDHLVNQFTTAMAARR
jgi:ABC-type Zn uptake system ZnuABC Zn-binding protein ZnuA